MSNFYSSLIINSKNFPGVHQVFRPRYNKEFFKRVTSNTGQLQAHVQRRYQDSLISRPPELSDENLKNVRDSAQKLVKLRERLEKTSFEDDEKKHSEMLAQIESLEDQIMPTVIRIPNRWSKQVPERGDQVVEELKTDFQARQGLSKVLSHRKLSYINHCYSKSVVGPNSHYYFGIGAKLQAALSDYFTSELEREHFVPVSGASLVKSAVVEAVNSTCDTAQGPGVCAKEFSTDPGRILTHTTPSDDNRPPLTSLHLAEASRESLVAFITTLGPIKSNEPLRLMTSGAAYRQGSEWFDGDERRITQFETLHALVLNSSIEQYSMREYHRVRDLMWASYKKLELPLRLVHCSLESMLANEYDAHRVEVWMPSQHQWLQVGRVSHYLDYITVRVSMRRGHLIDASVFDGQTLVAAIIENKQTAMGKFIVPAALGEHAPHLTDTERQNYFDPRATFVPPDGAAATHSHQAPAAAAALSKATVMSNHEQRRYLRKMEHPFGHSRKAAELNRLNSANRPKRIAIAVALLYACMTDWNDFWYDYTPDSVRRFLYEYTYRPVRRCWWWLMYKREDRFPPDLAYEELDKTDYNKTQYERRTERARSQRRPAPEVEAAQAAAEAARQAAEAAAASAGK